MCAKLKIEKKFGGGKGLSIGEFNSLERLRAGVSGELSQSKVGAGVKE